MPVASSATASVTVTAGATEGSYSVSFATKLSSGTALPATAVSVDVAKPGELWPYGLLGSATDAAATGATGTLTVSYTDGSTQQIPVAFSDWTLGAGSYTLLLGDTIAATMPYRNIDDGTQDPTTTYLYSVSAALQPVKTVASVTLPNPTNGYIGVFAISGLIPLARCRARSPRHRAAGHPSWARTVTGPGPRPYLPWSAWPDGNVPPAPSSRRAMVRLQ